MKKKIEQFIFDYPSLDSMIRDIANKYGGKVCLQVWEKDQINEAITYSELVQRAEEKSLILMQRGVQPGDRIAIIGRNSLQWIVALFAILFCKATAVPIDPELSESGYLDFLQNMDVQLALIEDECFLKIKSQKECYPLCLHLTHYQILGDAKVLSINGDGDSSIALICFTSGTTGNPKGIMLEHKSILAATKVVKRCQGNSSDSILCLLPLYHSMGVCGILLTALTQGMTITLLDKVYAPTIMTVFQKVKPTIFPTVPRIVELLYSHIEKNIAHMRWPLRKCVEGLMGICGFFNTFFKINLGRIVFRHLHKAFGGNLKAIITSASSLDRKIEKSMQQLGIVILQAYGQAETSSPFTCVDIKDRHLGAVGRPFSWQSVKIEKLSNTSADGNDALTPSKNSSETTIGELCLRGPSIMRGYFRQPEATAAALKDGWLHTGDLGYIDSKGYIVICGRMGEMLVLSSGKKVFPNEVDFNYRNLEGVKDLAAFGMPIGSKGSSKVLHLAVVVNEDLQKIPRHQALSFIENEVAKRGATLPSHHAVSKIHLIDEIPRNAALKAMRFALPKLVVEKGYPEDSALHKANPPDRDEKGDDPLTKQIISIIALVAEEANIKILKEITLTDNFQLDLGFDSLTYLQLIFSIENAFQIHFHKELLSSIYTVEKLLEAVREQTRSENICANNRDNSNSLEKEGDISSLSYQQQIIWKYLKEQADNPAYLVPTSIKIEGKLDTDLLESCIKAEISRNSQLSTSFYENGDLVKQKIEPLANFSMGIHDISKETMPTYLLKEWQDPIDVKIAPLMRSSLFRLKEREYIWNLVFNHLICDGWSVYQLIKKIGQSYSRKSFQEDITQHTVKAMSYFQYVMMQEEFFSSSDYKRSITYWQKTLDNLMPLNIPLDNSKPIVSERWGAATAIHLSSSLSSKLNNYANAKKINIVSILLTVLHMLLAKFSDSIQGASSVLFSGRTAANIINTFGDVSNECILYSDFSDNPSFESSILMINSALENAADHQMVSPEALQQVGVPVPAVSFDFQQINFSQDLFKECDAAPIAPQRASIPLWGINPRLLSFKFVRNGKIITAALKYRSTLFNTDTIDKLVSDYVRILDNALENPYMHFNDF